MPVSQKIINSNDQPAAGRGVVSIAGQRGLGANGTLISEISSTNIVSPFPPFTASELENSVSVNNDTYSYRYNSDFVLTAGVAASGAVTQTLVEAIPNRSMQLVGYTFVTDSETTIQFYSDSTPISSGIPFTFNGGAATNNLGGLVETNNGEALKLDNTAGYVGGHISYKVR
jgi:hypothetical protein